MNRDEIVTRLGSQLVEDIGARAPDWKHIVMVGRFRDDDPGMNGFVYLSDGTAQSFAPEDLSILDTLAELRTAMAKADRKEPWKAALFTINRATGELDGEFEYDDPSRWAISFSNWKRRAEELRPRD